MAVSTYIKSHPVSLKAMILWFAAVAGVSCILWFMVLTGYGAEAAAAMINEQDARAWLKFSASLSLLYLTLKVAIAGPILDYDAKDVKYLGTYAANAALGFGTAYVGIMWGALLPIAVVDPVMPDGLTLGAAFKVSAVALAALVILYCLYLCLYVNKAVHPFYGSPVHVRVIRFLAAPLALALFGRSTLELILILFPEASRW